MTQVVLTGGSGKLGRACLADLLDHGYSVTNVDLARPVDDLSPFVRADLTDMGQTMEVTAPGGRPSQRGRRGGPPGRGAGPRVGARV